MRIEGTSFSFRSEASPLSTQVVSLNQETIMVNDAANLKEIRP